MSSVLQDSRQGASVSGRPGLAEQPVYIYLVGIAEDDAEKALSALGDRGQRLILSSTLEVRIFCDSLLLHLQQKASYKSNFFLLIHIYSALRF